jgi:PAS domain S-box-containing protein
MKADPSTRLPRSPAALAVAVVLFAVVFALRLSVTVPGFGFSLLFDVPVAVVAVAFGLRAGLVAATVGLALFAFADATEPIHANGVAVYTNEVGYLSRALVFYLLGGLLGLYSDRARVAEAKVRESEAYFRRALEDSPVSVWSQDRDLRYTWMHNAMAGLLGGRVVGSTDADLVDAEAADRLSDVKREVLSTGHATRLEVALANGASPVVVDVMVNPVRGPAGDIAGITGTMTDITELKRAERALERSNMELEQFAHVASHDLREPLGTITGFAQLLELQYGGKLDDDGNRFIGFIVQGTGRMQAMIDDLLDYSREGQAEQRLELVDSGTLVRGALSSLDAAVREAGAEVELGELPTVNADPGALTRVFQNLLSNALKFTAARPPRVEVSAADGDGAWTFAVADNGLGIEAGDAERVFQMFERLHSREAYAGTGIGLPLCRRIVERHGGRIWCEPRTGGGTVFQFTIPDSAPALT